MPSLSSYIDSSLISKKSSEDDRKVMTHKTLKRGGKLVNFSKPTATNKSSPYNPSIKMTNTKQSELSLTSKRNTQTFFNPNQAPSKVSITTNQKRIELNESGEEIKSPKTIRDELGEYLNFSNINERDILKQRRNQANKETTPKVTDLKEAIDLFYSRRKKSQAKIKTQQAFGQKKNSTFQR